MSSLFPSLYAGSQMPKDCTHISSSCTAMTNLPRIFLFPFPAYLLLITEACSAVAQLPLPLATATAAADCWAPSKLWWLHLPSLALILSLLPVPETMLQCSLPNDSGSQFGAATDDGSFARTQPML